MSCALSHTQSNDPNLNGAAVVAEDGAVVDMMRSDEGGEEDEERGSGLGYLVVGGGSQRLEWERSLLSVFEGAAVERLWAMHSTARRVEDGDGGRRDEQAARRASEKERESERRGPGEGDG